MRRLVLPVVAGLTLLQSSLGFADSTYSGQIALTYSRSEGETTTFTEGPGGSATYYIEPLALDPEDYPLHEGPFVERAGSVSLDYARVSQDIRDTRELESGSTAGIALLFRQPGNPLYARIGYRRINFGKYAPSGSSTPYEYQQETTVREVALGTYVGRTSLLTIEADRQPTTLTTSAGSRSETDSKAFAIRGRHLARVSGEQHIALEGQVKQIRLEEEGAPSETNRQAEILFTYYPKRTVALSADILKLSGDTKELRGTGYGLGLDVYLTSRANAYLKIARISRDPPYDDIDSAGFGFAFRF